MPSAKQDPVESIRSFNRFYTRQLGLLNQSHLASEYSLTEARILYELAHNDGLAATDLRNSLGLDAGYLSRLLTSLAKRKLIQRTASAKDARQSVLNLTKKGRDAFGPLNKAAREQIAGMIDALPADAVRTLVESMSSVRRLLAPASQPAVPYIVRPFQVGDIGWVIHRQSMLYAQEYGWDITYEALVAEILGSFIKNFDAQWEYGWIAERHERIAGSVFLVRGSKSVAKLRLLYVEPGARGLGIGKRLVDECIRFARAKGYKTLSLWTNDVLVTARRIYEAAGFELIKQDKHHSFGKDLNGQTWELALT